MTTCKALEKAKRRLATKTPQHFEAGYTNGPGVIEREVKKFIKEIVLELDPDADIFMPVQTGYGAVDLDFIIGIKGYYLSIEAKANGKKPTHRQLQTIEKKVKAGCVALIIDESNLEDLVATVDLVLRDKTREAAFMSNRFRARYMSDQRFCLHFKKAVRGHCTVEGVVCVDCKEVLDVSG